MTDAVRLELGPALTVEWRLDALMRAADAADPTAAPGWSARADWPALAWLRLISCAAGEEGLLLVLARPSGAEHHDDDLTAGVRIGPAGIEGAEEVLVSTEYDAAGAVRRLGIELWLEGGSGKRVGADRSGEPQATGLGALSREATPMRFRLDGHSGRGLHELVRGPG